MDREYAQYAVEKAVELLGIDSPTGFTARAADWVEHAFAALGFAAQRTTKGGVLIDLGGAESAEGALLLQAHTDTPARDAARRHARGKRRDRECPRLYPRREGL